MSNVREQPSSEFDEFLAPLLLIVSVVYERTGSGRVLNLKKTYKADIQTNPEALESLKDIVKGCIKEVIRFVSTSYRQKLFQLYTEDGFIALVDYLVKMEIQKSLESV